METETAETFDISNITDKQIQRVVESMIGKQSQTPPIYSAIQINGKRAYEFARKGKDVTLKSREIEISKIEINKISLPDIYLTIHCSKGTYIRSLADEFGKRLDNGAFLYYLRRIKSGEFTIENAFELENFTEFLNNL
jgi:tRNA pseudouridine55 synthase